MGVRNVEGPWSTVTEDIMGPFPTSYSQHKYLVMFVDYFTKYVEIRAIPSANAQQVLEAFDELVVNRCGCSSVFLSDNGTEFYNKKVTATLQEYGIYQTTIPLYHPQPNLTERSNETLKTMISTFVKADHRTWDVHLAEFAFALNTMKQESTNFSPEFLNFGRNPITPNILRTEVEARNPMVQINAKDWAIE